MKTNKTVLAIDIKTGNMTYMQDLKYARHSHACGTYMGKNGTVVIVTGGYQEATTEIMIFDNGLQSTWSKGENAANYGTKIIS